MQILISMQNNQNFFYNIKAVQLFESLFFCILFWTPISAFRSRYPPSADELHSSRAANSTDNNLFQSIETKNPFRARYSKRVKYYYQRNQAAKSQSPATKCYPLNSPIAINLSCLSATSFSTGILDNVLMSFRSTFFTLSKVDSGS